MLKPGFKLLTRKMRYNYPKFPRSSLRSTPSIEHNVNPMVKTQCTIPELPDEIITEILKRLQVKYILRCMLVQKSWYYLIKSSVFIKLHLDYQNVTAHKYLLFETIYAHTFTVRYDDIQCEKYCKLKYLPDMPMSPFWYLTSHGLMCVSRMFYDSDYFFDPSIYLWNPLIQKYKTLPDSPLSRYTFAERKWQALAFGFVPEVSDYVVVHIVQPPFDSVMIGVYSLNADSWKKTRHHKISVSSIHDEDVVFISGTAFWLGYNLKGDRMVMCFDTKTDLLRVIFLPDLDEFELGNYFIRPSGQSIAYFTEYFKENADEHDDQSIFLYIWVLEDDLMSGESSWVKKTRINLSKNRGAVLGVRNNGEPIFAKEYNIVTYNLDNHEANDFVSSWNKWTPLTYCNLKYNHAPPFCISPYVESLVLLDSD